MTTALGARPTNNVLDLPSGIWYNIENHFLRRNIMDIKGKIEELVKKIKSDEGLLKKFKSDPISTVEGLIGIDLPNDQVAKIADGIKAKISLDSIGGKLGGLFGKK